MRVKIDDIRFPGIWCGFLLLLIQVQNENKTFRLLTSAFLWKASVFWFELILRISFPFKLRWWNESQCFCGVRFASDTVQPDVQSCLFCRLFVQRQFQNEKGLVRGYSDYSPSLSATWTLAVYFLPRNSNSTVTGVSVPVISFGLKPTSQEWSSSCLDSSSKLA